MELSIDGMHNPSSLPHDLSPATLRACAAFAGLFAACAALVWAFERPPAPMLAVSVLLGAGLSLLSGIDVRSYRLPDVLTLPLMLAGVAVAWWLDLAPVWWRAVSAGISWGLLAAVAALYQRARGRAGLGMGDAKLLAAAGAWVGAEGLPTVLLIGAVSALVLAGAARLAGRAIDGGTRVPFGPFLAFGIWMVWLLGPL